MHAHHTAASGGDRLHTLRELRDALAFRLDNCESSRDYATLVTQMWALLAEIDKLVGLRLDEDSPLEVVKRRREKRLRRAGLNPEGPAREISHQAVGTSV